MAPKKRDTSETKKKEFGTGLRAQLERRREEPDAAKPADLQPNVELRFELTARPADSEPFTVSSDGATDELRKELAAAQAREAALTAALAEQQEVFEAGMESDQGLARRASTLDERDAKLAEFQAELEERERKVRDQRQTIEAEHARLAELQAELAGEQQLSAESHEQAEKKLRELKGFDRDRSKFASELEKQRKALADREQKLARAEHELQTRERAGIVKLEGRERALAKREAELNRLKAELAHAQRDARFGADLEQRAAQLEERERELATRESALTSQEGLTDSQAKRQERREKRLASMEEAIRDRIRDLDE